MALQYILGEYLDEATGQAVYDKLEDGTFRPDSTLQRCSSFWGHSERV